MNRRTFLAATTASIGFGLVAPVHAQPRGGTRLTPVDHRGAGDGPADVATVRRRDRTYALIATHDADEIRSYRVDRDTGKLDQWSGTARVGPPRLVAATQNCSSSNGFLLPVSLLRRLVTSSYEGTGITTMNGNFRFVHKR